MLIKLGGTGKRQCASWGEGERGYSQENWRREGMEMLRRMERLEGQSKKLGAFTQSDGKPRKGGSTPAAWPDG